MHKPYIRHLACICALVAILSACTPSALYTTQTDVPEAGWSSNDTLHLAAIIHDTTINYDILLTLRHTDRYPYQNVWFFVKDDQQPTHRVQDTILACLANDRGQWLTKRAGRYYNGYIVIQRNIHFSTPDTLNLNIVHGMRDSLLTGIANVGIEIHEHN